MNSKRVAISNLDRVLHHILTIILLTIGLLMFYLSTIQPSNPTSATMSPKSILVIGFISLGLSILCFIWLESKLAFKQINISVDHPTAVNIVLETAKKNGWLVQTSNDQRMELTSPNNLGATPNQITIEFYEGFVLVNARGNYPTDKKIIKTLKAALTS